MPSELRFSTIYKKIITESSESTGNIEAVGLRCDQFIEYLENKNDILFLTTSNRWRGHRDDIPKSTQLAYLIQAHLQSQEKKVNVIDVSKLKIYTCEGNISSKDGNNCGSQDAVLKDKRLNPTGYHRCWASVNNKDDQLFKITRELFQSKVVVIFGSIRWGQTNSIYQRLMERLSWIENRVSSLGEEPIPEINKMEAGVVLFGHNWNGDMVLDIQKQNLRWLGMQVPNELSFNWQYTADAEEESNESYKDSIREFSRLVQISLPGNNT